MALLSIPGFYLLAHHHIDPDGLLLVEAQVEYSLVGLQKLMVTIVFLYAPIVCWTTSPGLFLPFIFPFPRNSQLLRSLVILTLFFLLTLDLRVFFNNDLIFNNISWNLKRGRLLGRKKVFRRRSPVGCREGVGVLEGMVVWWVGVWITEVRLSWNSKVI